MSESPPVAFQHEIVTSPKRFHELKDEWNALLAKSADPSPFAMHEWLSAWVDCYVGPDALQVVLLRRDGVLVAAAPLYVAEKATVRVLRLLGLQHVGGDSVAVLVDKEQPAEVSKALVDVLFDHLRWDAIQLYGVRAGGSFYRWLFTEGNRLTRETKIVTRYVGSAPFLVLEGTWEQFLSKSSKNFRRNYKRQVDACTEAGIVADATTSDTEIVARLDRVQARAWQGESKHGRMSAHFPFFSAVLPGLLRSGAADVVWAVEAGGRGDVGFLVSILFGDRAFLFITAFDSTVKKEISPGSLVHYRALERLCERGVRWVDFMPGNESYKERWTKTSELSWSHVFARPTVRGRLVALSQL